MRNTLELQPQEIYSADLFLGRDFDIWVLPWGQEFDTATILEDRKRYCQLRLSLLFCPLLKEHLKLTAQKY